MAFSRLLPELQSIVARKCGRTAKRALFVASHSTRRLVLGCTGRVLHRYHPRSRQALLPSLLDLPEDRIDVLRMHARGRAPQLVLVRPLAEGHVRELEL